MGDRNENLLLVHIRADMRRFRALTTGNTVIIGRKTLLTFPDGKPLQSRENIILSHDASFEVDGAIVCHDLNELQSALQDRDPDSVFVCGGEQIYRLLLPYCSTALVTMTETDAPADRFFPILHLLPNWILTDAGERQTENGVAFRFLTYTNTDCRSLLH
jgi:Dihydrofolate reductase